MRVFVALFLLVAAVKAVSIANDTLPPISDNGLPVQEHIQSKNKDDSVTLADDGYRYKVAHKTKANLHRDVNDSQSSEYLPPAAMAKDGSPTVKSVSEDTLIVDTIPEEKTLLSKDGYQYKTVRRLIYRQRRDVSELPANEYLPPTEVEPPALQEMSVPEVKTDLAEDGYRYKTVRRKIYRQRRDVNELPANEYLPLTDVKQPVSEEVSVAESVPEVSTALAEDGYRYKTVLRKIYRQRRDVNELLANEYLPPPDVKQPVSEEVSVAESVPEVSTALAEDGYRYKTVRRKIYRQRRDVNELLANEYLPPPDVKQPVSEEVSVAESVPEVSTALAEDGYRYKTVRRKIYRQRRDVNELPANEYLPPTYVKQPVSEEVSVAESVPELSTALAEDGYRYKTVRRKIYRQRRDVNELPANEYLPPTYVKQPVSEEVSVAESVPELSTALAEDGYRYKTVRRKIYRQRRDVNELPANEYLPPSEVKQQVSEEVSLPEVKTDLAEDGYRYKTVRRLKYRQRRDVNELPANEYLPPTEVKQPLSEEVSVAESVPEVSTALAEDGYRYKTVRRLKYRQRRDVSELPANMYLPPTEVKSQPPVDAEIVEAEPEIRTELADDGYRYKTIRRLIYRRQ